MAKLLVVEDDAALSAIIKEWLTGEGHSVEIADDGEDGLYRLTNLRYDSVILDWHLPGINGNEICRRYRAAGGQTPILMLTKNNSMVEGLNTGADDYMMKPFDGLELLARVKALLRRPPQLVSKKLERVRVMLDYNSCSVTVDGRTVKLLPKEFELLEFLLKHSERYFSADELVQHLWTADNQVGVEAVRVWVSRIRTKVDDKKAPSIIETAKGWGYRINEYYLRKDGE